MLIEALPWSSPAPPSASSLAVERVEERADSERRRLPQPWPPGEPGRPSTGGGASPPPGRRWWWSGSEQRRDQAGADGAAGCGSTVPGRPGKVGFSGG